MTSLLPSRNSALFHSQSESFVEFVHPISVPYYYLITSFSGIAKLETISHYRNTNPSTENSRLYFYTLLNEIIIKIEIKHDDIENFKIEWWFVKSCCFI